VYKLSLFFFSVIVSSVAFGDVGDLSANTRTVVSTDSPYTPTAADKHNYRYRAVFSQDVHNEVPGTLRIEKVQLPDSEGSPYKMAWTQTVDLTKIKTVAEKYKSLPFESAIGCCDYFDLRWDAYRLKFNVSVAGKKFACTSTDASKSEPAVECK
jgi:hypothetical protein